MFLSHYTVRQAGIFGLGLALALITSVSQASDRTRTYEVEITNLTDNNQLTPVLAAVHSTRLTP